MESTPTHQIAKSTGFSLKCNMQSSQWGNTRPPRCLARGSGWQQLPCAVTSFISRLTTHINIYAPQIEPDPTGLCSDKFIIKLKRVEGQWQQEDTPVNRQAALPQLNHTVKWYRNSKATHCFAPTVWQTSKVLIRHRVNGTCINFYSVISKLLSPLLQNFALK